MNKKFSNVYWIVVVLCGMMFLSCEEEQEPPTAPIAPTTVRATVLSSSEIRVTWVDKSDNEDGFRVERARLDSLPLTYLPIGYTGANVSEYVDEGLTPLTSYAYRVIAFNVTGTSRPSPISVGLTERLPEPPNAPLSLQAIPISNSRVYLSWQDNSNNETGFRIERSTSGTASFFGLDTVNANVDHYEDKDLTAQTTYQYRIRAYNSVGPSDFTAVVTVIPGTNVIPPFAPSNLNANAVSATQVHLTWTDNSSNEGGFKVERAPGGTSLFSVITTLAKGVTSYRDKSLDPATPYTYKVQAFNNVSVSSYSNAADATTYLLTGPPVAPTELKATVKSATQIWLEWNDNADNEDGYYIERAPGSTTDYDLIATVNANVSTFHVVGLNTDNTYTFRVRAFNRDDVSAYSNTITRKTSVLAGTPASPSQLKFQEATAAKIRFTWSDNSGNEDGFQIERAPGGTGDFIQLGTTDVSIREYTDFEVQQSTSYRYRVRAYNLRGSSNYTNTIIAQTSTLTETRFINGSSHSIVSLIIDDQQRLTHPEVIPAGSFLPIQLAPGRHNYSIRNGRWDGLMAVPIYSDTGQFIQQENTSGSVSFTNPTIFQILPKFKYSGAWMAKFNGGVDSMTFRFFADGTYFFFNEEGKRKNGLYTLVQYNTDFTVRFSTGDYEGILSEEPNDNFFIMPNGPGNQTLQYYYQDF